MIDFQQMAESFPTTRVNLIISFSYQLHFHLVEASCIAQIHLFLFFFVKISFYINDQEPPPPITITIATNEYKSAGFHR